MNEFSRVVGVYLDPKEAFGDIVARPNWWAPMLLLSILSVVFAFCYAQHVGWERAVRQTLESNERIQSMPVEQRRQAVAVSVRIAPIVGYVGAAVGRPINTFIAACVFLVIFNVVAGAKVTLTLALSSVLSIITLYLKSPDDFDVRNPLAFNVGYFLSDDATPRWLVVLGSSLDLFSFWTLGLLATGFAICCKISWSKALFGVLVAWLIWVAIIVGQASIFS
jgi:hypothetical protein